MKLFSQIISWVFIPLLTPIYGLLLALYVPSSAGFYAFNSDCLYTELDARKWAVVVMFTFFTALVPAVAYVNMRARGYITTIEMDDRKERNAPIIIMFLSCLALFVAFLFMIRGIAVPKYLFSLPLSGMVAALALYFLTQWKKVSMHAAGVGIMTGFLLEYSLQMEQFQFWTIIVAVLLSGLVGSARIYLGKHTLLEVFIGWITGTFLTFVVNYLY